MGLSDLFSSGGTKQNSGFLDHEKGLASGAAYGGLQGMADSARAAYNSPIPQFNMISSIPGLFQEQEGAANAFANKMFAKASAGGALRGQFSQNNTPGLVGSAITNMGATLLPIIGQNLQNQMLIPEQIRTQRFQNAMSPLQALVAGLGGSGQSAGPGLGYTGANMFMGGLFGGGGEKPTGAQGGLSALAGALF